MAGRYQGFHSLNTGKNLVLVVEDSRLPFGECTRWTIPNEHRCLSSYANGGACLIPRPARLDRVA